MLIKTVSTVVTTDSTGKPIDSIPVRTASAGETDAAGRPVDIIPVTEDPNGVPVRVVTGKATQNSAGQWIDTLPVQGMVSPGYLTGTPMATLSLTVTAGSYPFAPTSYSRQMQASDDGMTGWADTGAPFTGASFVVGAGLVGKCLRLVETATDGSQSLVTTTPVTGPVVAFVALAAMPLAAGAKVAAIGNSQIGYNNYYGAPIGTGGQIGTKAAVNSGYGFIAHARTIDPRFRFESWYDVADPTGRNMAGGNQGVFSDHLDWPLPGFPNPGIIGRLPAVLTRHPDVLVLEGGINTISSGDDGTGVGASASYVIQKLDACLSLARKAAVPVILMAIYPRGDWSVGDPRHAIVAAANAWINAQAGRNGVIAVLDATDILAPGGVFDPTMYRGDLIHLSIKGAFLVGRDKLLPIIQANISAGSYFDQDPTVGNLLPATLANLEGTSGTKTGTPNTGTVPTGITVARGRNCAIVNSIDPYAAGKNRMNMAITPGGTDSGEYYEITVSGLTTPTFATEATKWYQAFVFVEADTDTSLAFAEVIASLRLNTMSQVISYGGSREASGDFVKPMPANRGWWVQSEKFTNVDAATIDRANILVRITGPKVSAPLNVKISRPIIREVADPRPAWGY